MCKQAMAAQINQMHDTNNKRKIGLVTFEQAIEVIGDGVEKPQVVDQGIYYDYDQLLANGLA